METTVGTLAAKLTLQTADFAAGATGAISKIDAIAQAFQAIGGTALNVAKRTSNSAMEFETAFTGVKKTVNAPAGNDNYFSDLRGQILDLSTELPSTATEIANVAATAGQLGIAAEDLLDFSTVMLQLASATNLTSDAAATKLAQFANVTGMSADNYGRLGSSVVALGNNMATTEAQIVDFAQEMAMSGSNAGMTEAEILGWGAAMASMGLEAASSGTAFQRFTADITGAVAGTNDRLDTFAKYSGMRADEFVTAWETDASGAMQTFLAGVGGLSSAEQLKVWDDLGISQQQEIQMLGSLAANTDLVTQALDLSNNAWMENTALTTEANAASQTTAAKLQMIKNTTEALIITLGDALLPIISDVVEAVKPAIAQLSSFVQKHPRLTKAIMAVIGALGAAAVVLGTVAKAVTVFSALSKIGGLFSGIGTAISGAFSGIAGAIAGALPAIGSFLAAAAPIIAIIAAIVVVIYALKKAYDANFLGMRDTLEPFVSGFKSACSAVGSYVSGLWDTFQNEGMGGVFEKIKTDVSGLWENTLQPKLTEIKDKVVQWFADFDLGASLSALASSIGTAIGGWWSGTVSPALSTLGTNIVNFFGSIDLGAALSALATVIGVTVGGWWTLTLLPAFEGIATSISDFFGAIDLGEAMGKIAGTIATAVSGWWENKIKPALGNVGQAFADFFGLIDLAQVGMDIIETLKTGLSGAWDGVKTWFSDLVSDLFGGWNPIGDVKNYISGLFGGGEEKEAKQVSAGVKSATAAGNGIDPSIAGAAARVTDNAESVVTMPTGVMSVDVAALNPVSEEVIASWQALADAITAVNTAIADGGGMGDAAGAAGASASPTDGGSGLINAFGQIKTLMAEIIGVATLLSEAFGGTLVASIGALINVLCVVSTNEDGSTKASGGNTLYNSLGAIFGVLGDILATSRGIADHWTGEFVAAVERLKKECGKAEGVVQSLAASASGAAGDFNEMADAIWRVIEALEALDSTGGAQAPTSGKRFNMTARAAGGPVIGGTTYLVGEEGPELFTPSRSGYIVPNDELSRGGSDTVINVTFSGDVIGDEKSITAYVTRAVKAGIRQEVLYGC